MKAITLSIAVALAGAPLGAMAAPVLVVDFGPSTTLVTGNTGMQRFGAGTLAAGTTTDRFRKVDYSESAAVSPASNYTGPTFYGGAELLEFFPAPSSANPNFDDANIENNATADRIHFRIQPGSGIQSASAAVLISFLQADGFTAAAQGDTVSFDGDSQVSFKLVDNAGYGVRVFVKNNGSYYLSETAFTGTNSGNAFTLSPTAVNWASYDPTTALNFNQGAATYGAVNFGDVEAVGFYFENDNQTSTTAQRFRLSQFTVEGNVGAPVIPEPATLGMGLLGVGMLMLRRSRRA